MTSPLRHACWFAILGLCCVELAAQRPRTPAEALSRFDAVREQGEAERRRAVADLGEFGGEDVTAVLLQELARASGLAYRQTVVRALGGQPRPAAVPALRDALQSAANARLMDAAAEALARQGDAGVQALGAVLAGESRGARRTAVLEGLGRADGDAARDLLIAETKTTSGRDRLPALRALARRTGDRAVDELRVLLARDKDPLVACTALRQLATNRHVEAAPLALELHRRTGEQASAEEHAAILHGLLLAPVAAHHEAILVHAARADDPLGKAIADAWEQALADAAFVRWLAGAGPQRKAAAERATAAQALGRAAAKHAAQHAATAATALVRLLQAKEPDVARAAADALCACGRELALPPLDKLLAGGPEPMQPVALQALATLRGADPDWAAALLRHAAAKAPSLRAAALQLLARCDGAPPVERLAAAEPNLTHASWSVRAAAIDLLRALRLAAGVPLLIDCFERETARVRADVEAALHDLTQQRFATAAQWRDWWSKEGATFAVAPPKERDDRRPRGGRAAATTASYWSLPVHSDRCAFVVDVSGSMNQPFATDGTRLDEAKRQLERVFAALPATTRANVIAFGNDAGALADRLQPIDEARRKAAAQYVRGLEARGATNVHAALQLAFADAEIDTIYLLTDGQPSAGAIVAPDDLARAVAGWNAGRGVRIHTVALGGRSELLARLAQDSGGEHTVAR